MPGLGGSNSSGSSIGLGGGVGSGSRLGGGVVSGSRLGGGVGSSSGSEVGGVGSNVSASKLGGVGNSRGFISAVGVIIVNSFSRLRLVDGDKRLGEDCFLGFLRLEICLGGLGDFGLPPNGAS